MIGYYNLPNILASEERGIKSPQVLVPAIISDQWLSNMTLQGKWWRGGGEVGGGGLVRGEKYQLQQ